MVFKKRTIIERDGGGFAQGYLVNPGRTAIWPDSAPDSIISAPFIHSRGRMERPPDTTCGQGGDGLRTVLPPRHSGAPCHPPGVAPVGVVQV